MSKENLFLSVSGGETSAFMAKLVIDHYGEQFNIVTGFANTGQEREETLAFVNRCDKEWGLNVVWLEADVNPAKGQGTGHKIVSFETANRNGSVFESMIAKYGLPNMSYLHCTRELKLQPITSYLRSIGWKAGTYTTAIGIRADEIDRMDENFKAKRFWYPLVEHGITKTIIKLWWAQQAFRLGLKEHQGNCTWCWKKTDRKHFTLMQETPEIYNFPIAMEAKYSMVGSKDGNPRSLFRKGRTTLDMFRESKKPFSPFVEHDYLAQGELDITNGCTDSCEAFA